jgi:hypothetical protein
MSDCSACSDPLPNKNDCAKCSVCSALLHFECAGISDTTWSQMRTTRRDLWKCSSCKTKESKASGCKDPVSKDNLNKIRDEIITEIKKIIKCEFADHEKKLEEKLNDFTLSLNFYGSKIDDFQEVVNGFSCKLKDIEKNCELLKKENTDLCNQILSYKIQLENLEQYNRNRNVEVTGVPEIPQEKMSDIVEKLSDITGVNIDMNKDIQAVHRVPTRNEKGPKPIVMQFSNRQLRDEFLKNGKKSSIKSTDFVPGIPSTKVYVNEHLTPYNRNLLYHAKKLREKGFKYVWTVEGKVFVRKSESDRSQRVFSVDDVDKLLCK